MRLTILVTVSLLALLAAPASAQPGLAAPGQSAPYAEERAPAYVQKQEDVKVTTRYGWQIIAVDLATWVAISSAEGDGGIATVGALGLLFGGPIVHLANGNSSSAGYSLLARGGLPLAGGLLGAATCDDDDNSYDDAFGCLGKIGMGVLIGYGSALVLDWAYLSKKTEWQAPRGGLASLRPSLQVTDDGAQAGVAMNF